MAKKDTSPRYVILHDGVGLYRQGQTASAVELGIQGDDENLQRLLDLGAIVAVSDAPAASDDTMTLAEALRTASPPTLPVVPAGVETTPEEVAQVMDPANPATTNPLPDAS